MAASGSSFQEVVFQKDAVLEGVVPALDLTLCLGMHRRAPDILHTFVFQVSGQIARDVEQTIVTEKPGFVQNFCAAST